MSLFLTPQEARAKLTQLRQTVKAAARGADERISYKIPYYKYSGAPLVAFAAFNNHVGLYAVPVREFERELAGYITGRGSVQFPLDRPLPVALIKKLLRARIKKIKSGKGSGSK
jgi:uncharacterized protein YdhG (YjbR/CyaY superfamily)